MFPCEICEIFKNTLFHRTPLVAATTVPIKFEFHNNSLKIKSNVPTDLTKNNVHCTKNEVFH